MSRKAACRKVGGIIGGIALRAFLILWCAFSVFAIIWIVFTSLKTNKEFFSGIWNIPEKLRLENYIKVWNNYRLGTFFLNSLVVIGLSVAGILVISTPAAYVLSRVRFRLAEPLKKFFVFGMGVPYQLLLVPLFFLLFTFRLLDNFFGLIIVYITLSLPFSIFLMIGFFKTLPSQLEEAAAIDGSSPIQTFLRIMIPLGQPGIITSAIFNFIWLWNEFLMALTLLSRPENYTLSLGLYSLQGSMQYTGDWVCLFAGFVYIIVPTLLIYLFLSRKIISGLTLGAVKE